MTKYLLFGLSQKMNDQLKTGKVSEPITISRIDGGRSTGVPQLEILNDEIFIVWTVSEDEINQLKTVKLSSANYKI